MFPCCFCFLKLRMWVVSRLRAGPWTRSCSTVPAYLQPQTKAIPPLEPFRAVAELTNQSPQEFLYYVKTRTPVVIRGGIPDW